MGVYYGHGTYVFPDGGQYIGEYRNTVKGAKGVTRALYDSKRHGLGVRIWVNGSRYEGRWVEDLQDGEGELTTLLGSKYVGFFCKGCKCVHIQLKESTSLTRFDS